jgi:hypothetical protein
MSAVEATEAAVVAEVRWRYGGAILIVLVGLAAELLRKR